MRELESVNEGKSIINDVYRVFCYRKIVTSGRKFKYFIDKCIVVCTCLSMVHRRLVWWFVADMVP